MFGWPGFLSCLCFHLVLSALSLWGQEEKASSLSGFESSELYAVKDGEALDPNDRMLQQLIYRTLSISKANWEKYSQYSDGVEHQRLLDDPQEHRFWVFEKSGRVTRIARQTLPEELATKEFKEFWLLVTESEGDRFAVICRSIPQSWRVLKKLAEPIELSGFFYGLKQMPRFFETDESVPIFVCNQIRWYPDRVLDSVNIGAAQIYLANSGVDLTQLDLVRRNQKRKMLAEENDYFYQMLNAANHAQANEELNEIPKVGFLDLIKESNKHLGGVVEIEGNVRRIVAVPITSAAERQRLGRDHFYEMDMYVPLTDVAKIRAKDKDGNDIEYSDRFPVTVHLPSLPEPVTEYQHNRVRVKGFFYRWWSYQSEFAKQTNQRGQMSPLIIGFEPKILRGSTQAFDTILTVAAVAFILSLFGLIFYLRYSDRNSTSPLSRKEELPDRVDIPPVGD